MNFPLPRPFTTNLPSKPSNIHLPICISHLKFLNSHFKVPSFIAYLHWTFHLHYLDIPLVFLHELRPSNIYGEFPIQPVSPPLLLPSPFFTYLFFLPY